MPADTHNAISMKTILMFVMLIAPATLFAQSDPEYRMEIGGGLGVMNYIGDFNGSIIRDFQPSATIVARRIFNPYMGLKANLSYGKMKGDAADEDNYHPYLPEEGYSFDNTLVDLSITYEYNFWPYGTGKDYRGAKRLTPFIFGGIGATYCTGEEKDVFTANIPVGLGVKYKIGERTNLGVEWAMHFSLSDKLDGWKDPLTVKSTGPFKNTDCYSTLFVTFTYSFMAKCRTCHNDNE